MLFLIDICKSNLKLNQENRKTNHIFRICIYKEIHLVLKETAKETAASDSNPANSLINYPSNHIMYLLQLDYHVHHITVPEDEWRI